jgi:crotonobetainyl-CoA:carnitine CoA-transferase CaiB-like acyl-CoA transferase
VPTPPAQAGQHTREVLSEWGLDEKEIDSLFDAGAAR